jgi:fumarate hydratase subunit alpha
MREVKASALTEKVKELFLKANVYLPRDTEECLKKAYQNEPLGAGKSALKVAADNLVAARESEMPICQDTGMAVVFVDIGSDVHITDGFYEEAINEGVRQAYKEGYFRLSVVDDPLFERKNTADNTPAVIYTRIVPGEKIDVCVEPKGFGSENMSRIKMFNPSVDKQAIIDFAVQTVKEAGGNPCPPVVLGIGIGSDFEGVALLSKRALCRDISIRNDDDFYKTLEEKMLKRVNELHIGPQGFGGEITALAVNIETAPTHIAGLPVAVNVGCHVTRHKEITL